MLALSIILAFHRYFFLFNYLIKLDTKEQNYSYFFLLMYSF